MKKIGSLWMVFLLLCGCGTAVESHPAQSDSQVPPSSATVQSPIQEEALSSHAGEDGSLPPAQIAQTGETAPLAVSARQMPEKTADLSPVSPISDYLGKSFAEIAGMAGENALFPVAGGLNDRGLLLRFGGISFTLWDWDASEQETVSADPMTGNQADVIIIEEKWGQIGFFSSGFGEEPEICLGLKQRCTYNQVKEFFGVVGGYRSGNGEDSGPTIRIRCGDILYTFLFENNADGIFRKVIIEEADAPQKAADLGGEYWKMTVGELPVFVSDKAVAPAESFFLSSPLTDWMGKTFRQLSDKLDAAGENWRFPIAGSYTSLGMAVELDGAQLSIGCERERDPQGQPPLLDSYTIDRVVWQYWPDPQTGEYPDTKGLPEILPGLAADFTVEQFRDLFGLPESYPVENAEPTRYSAAVRFGDYEMGFSHDPDRPLGKTVYLKYLPAKEKPLPDGRQPLESAREAAAHPGLAAGSPARDWLGQTVETLRDILPYGSSWVWLDGYPGAYSLRANGIFILVAPREGEVILQREYDKNGPAPQDLPDICEGLPFSSSRDEILRFFGLPEGGGQTAQDGLPHLSVNWDGAVYRFWFDREDPQLLGSVQIEAVS